jgi:hypothetical protein
MRHSSCSSAVNVNLLGYNLDTIRENTEALTDVSKEVGPNVNIEKIKYTMSMPRRQNGRQIIM